MLCGVLDVEGDPHFREEVDVEAHLALVRADVEGEAIGARRDWSGGERHHAAFFVGDPAADRRPLARLAELENHGHADCPSAAGGIENVCGDHDRCSISLARRSRVIARCSPAAIPNSRSGVLPSRRSRASSISAADLPVAQMMKMYPKRASYSRFPRARRSL